MKGSYAMKRMIAILPLTALLLTGCAQNTKARMSDNSTADVGNVSISTETAKEEAGNAETNRAALLGLTWYSSMENAKQTMSVHRLDDQSEETGSNGRRQTLLEYDNMHLYGQPGDVTLVFTDQGLTSIIYHAEEDNYHEWSNRLMKMFGTPAQDEGNRLIWNDPMQDGRTAAMLTRTADDADDDDDEVNIVFYADAE